MTPTPAASWLPDLLRDRLAEDAEAVALEVADGPALSYRAWDARSAAAARGLAARGVRRGERVALLFDNSRWTDYAVAYLAALRLRAVAVPLTTRFSATELTAILTHSGPVVVVAPRDLGTLVRAGSLEVGELERGGAGGAALMSPEPRDSEDLAEILYTSGTTGTPKGVAVPHASLLAHDLPAADADVDAGSPAARRSFLHAFPIGTNAGQECLRMPLRRQVTAVVLPAFDPDRLCALVAERGVRRLQLVPAMAQVLVASGAPSRHDVSSVERITLSSAPTPPALLPRLADAFPHASLWNAYALTEGGSARTLMRYDPARPTAVGRPVGETQLRIVDEVGDEVPRGATGEVWLRRPGTPRREYYRDPQATALAYAGDWLRTGDLGYVDDDGYLYLVDRKKDVIISGGANIASVEVEHVLSAHPAVRDAAVFALPHEVLGQDVAAAVVVDVEVPTRELQAFVRERLGEHKVPRRVFLVDELPRNATGKLLKGDLRERFGAAEVGVSATPPRDELEAEIVAIWREVLDRDDVGVERDFFDLGGHSLAAARVVARLQDAFDLELPVTAVFEHPTVGELAAAVRRAREDGAP